MFCLSSAPKLQPHQLSYREKLDRKCIYGETKRFENYSKTFFICFFQFAHESLHLFPFTSASTSVVKSGDPPVLECHLKCLCDPWAQVCFTDAHERENRINRKRTIVLENSAVHTRAATSESFQGAEVTFGNAYDVINVQSTIICDFLLWSAVLP